MIPVFLSDVDRPNFRMFESLRCYLNVCFAHVPPNLQPSFVLGLTHDVRVPIITRRLRTLLFQVVVTRMLLLFSRRAIPYDALLSHLCCHISVIDVQAERERGRSRLPFALPLLPSWCLKLQESPLEQCPFNQSQITSTLVFCFRFCFSHYLFVGLELHSRSCLFGSSISESHSSSECSFLVHSFWHCILIVPGKDGPLLF